MNAVTLSTESVAADDAVGYWCDMICDTFVRLSAAPAGVDDFFGRITSTQVGDVELSDVVAAGQHVRRTKRFISGANDEFLLASVQLSGTGVVEQDGRSALLHAGEMAFYDSTRPYGLEFPTSFRQLVIQVPKIAFDADDTARITARRLGHGTPGAVVAKFLTAVMEESQSSPDATKALGGHVIGLLSAAASFADVAERTVTPTIESVRARALELMTAHLADPRLDADTIARRCNVSRRTLYRALAGEGFAERLRTMRIDRARTMLDVGGDRPLGLIAAACGYESESGFHRAFRTSLGMTPGEYRAR
ncbi:helix-turn-helix domain-containing protein [Gordonia sp. TBRC 11910]|uniref:Helix-turn-helix domain-containing protein n=1 Tax=Gordonia asplenii TaxID=2725283 RepID=A0A848L2D3_9ACTN|nr:helix-turn-helix domain-containing protein [Gordonia asplenii]NMO02763.1 helix-turn-helix domain-containing protein [Gordonia asplenii]